MSEIGDGAPLPGATENVSRRAEPMVMDGLSSSKVTVEYHDPSGVFSLIEEDLTSRLPLRNLHWKAPTRPLRSIDSLHVDLIPSKESLSASATLAIPQGTPIRTTEEILRPPVKEKERRHQIPGLRQTPYLKVYLLRCDDSDTYKATARRQVREWVKEHTPPSQSSSSSSTQENHDAYEWMIVHVVIPDTPASNQPRGSSNSSIGEKEKSSTSVFKRGTTTLLEKLRADFNISSKTAPDRVAQIRVPKEGVPPHMLPAPASVTSPPVVESPQEQNRAWADVIAKFKTLILLSFDLRVSQYEEDVRKNDAQRSFPGWNFNTFFILKEGLARGFESVGLVEDALLGYDELSVGLDTVIRDQANEGSEAQGGVILDHSEDVYKQVAEIWKQSREEGNTRDNTYPNLHNDKPINAQEKDYRGLILQNQISFFDFRLYVFARQMSLLLRLGNSQSARSDLAAKLQPRPNNTGVQQRSANDSNLGLGSGSQGNDPEDLFSFAELCSRAINFITFAGRLLRDDVMNGAKTHEASFPEALVDNVVRSWTFAAIEQILRETSTSSLPFTRYLQDVSTGSSGKILSFGSHSKDTKLHVSEQKTMIHPSRSSSLSRIRSNGDAPYAQPATSAQVVFENGQYHDRPPPSQEIMQAKNGLQELAGTRAHLLAIQRRLLEQVGKALGWSIGWAAIVPPSGRSQELTEVDLDDKNGSNTQQEGSDVGKGNELVLTIGIFAKALAKAVLSIDQFRHLYETLSDSLVKHYNAAGQIKSAENVLGDMAAIRFELGDYAAAAAYFGRMASKSSMFVESRWNTVEIMMLRMYAHCLKKLNRKDEYIRTLLELLAISAASRMSFKTLSKRADARHDFDSLPGWLNDNQVDTLEVFHELVDFSPQLPYDVTVQMPKYFGDISVEPYVRHYDDKDGFQLRLQFRHVLEDEIDISAAKVRVISADSTQGKDIWLESPESATLKKGLNRLWLGCNVNTIGPYMIDKIVLEAKRIIFIHEPFAKTEATTPLGIITSVSAHSLKAAKKARILCFPRKESFDARIILSHFIHIDKPRHIEIECESGWNNISHAEVRLKSASAGLRLRTANTTVVHGEIALNSKQAPGVIAFGAMAANSTATLKIPYDMETILQDLTIKIEVDYTTEAGIFQFVSTFTIPVELPLDVNVHEHFKKNSLFSKFNIKTANQIPLELLDVELQSSEEFKVHAPRRTKEPVYVFPKQPIAFTYKVTKRTTDATQRRQSRISTTGSLALSVEYRLLDEVVRQRIQSVFAADIEAGPIHRLARLLVNTFADRLEHKILPHQIERIALLDKVDIDAFDDMGWSECLDGLPQVVSDDTRAWLQKWHADHQTIHLKPSSSATTAAPLSLHPPRQMIISVSIPQTHVLHTASLTPANITSNPTIATVGLPFQTTLRISHTRRWASSTSLLSAANLTSPADVIDFVYTLEANPDTWLIAGQRRAHFTAKEDEVIEWEVLLIPLKAGVTLFPSVDIRARIKAKDDAKEGEVLHCETDYLSYGETVIVVPDVRSSTVGIGDMSAGLGTKGVVWLESSGQTV